MNRTEYKNEQKSSADVTMWLINNTWELYIIEELELNAHEDQKITADLLILSTIFTKVFFRVPDTTSQLFQFVLIKDISFKIKISPR